MNLRCAIAALLASTVTLLGGCATVMSGTHQKVTITSDPPGAQVNVDGQSTLTTPATPELSRKHEHTLLVSKAGFHTERVMIRQEMNAAILGNIILGGVIGGVADLASGAAAKLEPENVHVKLVAVTPGRPVEVREWNPPKQPKAKAAQGEPGDKPGPRKPAYSD